LAQLFFKPRGILVPVRGCSVDVEAFRLACSFAREAKSKLYALYVIEVERDLPVDAEITGEIGKGEEILQEIETVSREEKCTVVAEILQARQAGLAIVHEALERDVDLIVLGVSHPNSGASFKIGKNTQYILKNASCPVILWREQRTIEQGQDQR
jgi:nucleotide-binding universal stress UspA family protein